MASLYITEFVDGAGALQAAQMPPQAEQKLTISGTSAASAAIAAKVVRVHTDTACHVAFGASPTATVSNLRMPADSTEYFGVTAGHKIAVVAAA